MMITMDPPIGDATEIPIHHLQLPTPASSQQVGAIGSGGAAAEIWGKSDAENLGSTSAIFLSMINDLLCN